MQFWNSVKYNQIQIGFKSVPVEQESTAIYFRLRCSTGYFSKPGKDSSILSFVGEDYKNCLLSIA